MSSWLTRLREGTVIPAHPLALDAAGRLDERRQRALTRYYAAAGSGGIAVGVHTTQFEIRRPDIGLYEPVLALAAETVGALEAVDRPLVRVAGIAGDTQAALREARTAVDLGYHCGLVSLSAFPHADNDRLVAHLGAVGEAIPVFGFYLQTAVGGRPLDGDFWRRALALEALVAIKVAPFDREATLTVARAVAESGRTDVPLYTGNDDHIIHDLLTTFAFGGDRRRIRFAGGLLGQWAMWTRRAVEHFDRCRTAVRAGGPPPRDLDVLAAEVTDANAAIFDARNGFAGCVPGIHEVLRRQGLLAETRCLDPDASLSPGQSAEIDRVWDAYPHLRDDDFVRAHLDDWLC